MLFTGTVDQLLGGVLAVETLPLPQARLTGGTPNADRLGLFIEVDGDALAAVTAKFQPVIAYRNSSGQETQYLMPGSEVSVSGTVNAAGDPARFYAEVSVPAGWRFGLVCTAITGTNAVVTVKGGLGNSTRF